MLSCGGFQKHDDKLPTAHISPRLLNATVADNSLGDNNSTTASKDGLSSDEGLSHENYLRSTFGCDDFLPLEDDTRTNDDGIGIVERLSPMEYIKRLMLLKSALGPPSELCVNTNLPMLPESSRDCRHNGDLYWHDYYHMSDLSAAVLPPMRYVYCGSSNGLRCFHEACPMLQIFSIKLMTYLQGVDTPVKIYGFIAIRDNEDYHRNYIFSRSRDDPLTINPDIFCISVPLDDRFYIDFKEGKLPIPFKAVIHGSQEKEYHFKTNAVVSVKVSWSTAFH